jgi:hypothetical protein
MSAPLCCLVDANPAREVWTWLWPRDRLTIGGRGCDLLVPSATGPLAEVVVDEARALLRLEGEVRTLAPGELLTVGGSCWWVRPAHGPRAFAPPDEAAALTRLGHAWIGAQGLHDPEAPLDPALAASLLTTDPAQLEEAALWLRFGQPGLGMEVWLRSATWRPEAPDRLGSVGFEVTTVDRMDPFSQQVQRRQVPIEALVYADGWKVQTLIEPQTRALLTSWLARGR